MQTRLMVFAPAADPFSDDKEDKSASAKDHVHIRVQQRNGRKSLTTVQVGYLDRVPRRVRAGGCWHCRATWRRARLQRVLILYSFVCLTCLAAASHRRQVSATARLP